jgi:hypothetical protein
MDDYYVKELALKLYNDMYTFWTEEERKREWERNQTIQSHYTRLAEVAMNYFHTIYYQL